MTTRKYNFLLNTCQPMQGVFIDPYYPGPFAPEQNSNLEELDRLMSGARRSARLAFPADLVKLHSDFQVGINEPQTLEDDLRRAGIILAACRDAANASALKRKGWKLADSDALETAIEKLSGASEHQDEALDDRKGLTGQKIVAANDLYADALCIQNAARLEYPANKPGNETARARFLLKTFPPRDRSEPSGGTQTPPAATLSAPTPV